MDAQEPRAAIVVVMPEVLSAETVAELCERVRAFVESRATLPVVCDVSALTAPDAVMLDALARVQLVARRAGTPVGLRNAPSVLVDLLALVGFSDALPAEALRTSGVDGGRLVEEREQPGIDEEVHPRDAVS